MKGRKWRSQEIQALLRYPEEGAALLAAELGRSEDAVTSLATRLGLRSRTRHHRQALSLALKNRSVNVHFFETMSAAVAYVLGFTWAGGDITWQRQPTLRFRCPLAGEARLHKVLHLLESKHPIQPSRGQVTCAIASLYLVRSLVTRFGLLPNNDPENVRLPVVPAEVHHHLARGLRDGAGGDDANGMSWSGPARLMNELQQLIRTATGMPEPLVQEQGRHQTISWTTLEHVAILKCWLTRPPESHSGEG